MNSFFLINLFFNTSILTKIIIFILFSFSVISWAIIFYKILVIYFIIYKIKRFEIKFWSGVNLTYLYEKISVNKDNLYGLELIFFVGFKEFKLFDQDIKNQKITVTLEKISDAMNLTIYQELEYLDSYIPFLGIVGSNSPYIGLLGTVWGIIKTFNKLNNLNNQNITLSLIAPGISESLIATMVSLIVAIPNLIAFNFFKSKINRIENRYLNFTEEFKKVLYHHLILKDK